MLVLPLVIMGAVSVLGGLSGLRLPETLYHRLPQTVEEGEEFGKDWSCADCLQCVPQRPSSVAGSYEDLDERDVYEMREQAVRSAPPRRSLNKAPRLVRQSSVMETPRDSSGVMQMTYWF